MRTRDILYGDFTLHMRLPSRFQGSVLRGRKAKYVPGKRRRGESVHPHKLRTTLIKLDLPVNDGFFVRRNFAHEPAYKHKHLGDRFGPLRAFFFKIDIQAKFRRNGTYNLRFARAVNGLSQIERCPARPAGPRPFPGPELRQRWHGR